MSRGLEGLGLACLVAAITLPFLDKPFHIDDLYTLQGIENVLRNPLDPIGGMVGWASEPRLLRHFELNPPFLPYFLAPFARIGGTSEILLHAAMIPFYLALAGSLLWLGRRFTGSSWLVLLLVMTSPAVTVSGNLMRDVPATALAVSAIAATIAGTDRGRNALLLLGGVLAGLAMLTKYSSTVLLGLLPLYPVLHASARRALWSSVAFAMFGLWCAHNLWVYGEIHVVAISQGGLGPWRAWRDNLCGLPVVMGSICVLLPALLARSVVRRDTSVLAAIALGVGLCVWATLRYLEGAADVEYLFWSLCGSGLLIACALEALRGAAPLLRRSRDPAARDSLFLFAWLCAPLLFSVVSVPFQAVRHLIMALPPSVLLGVRLLERGGRTGPLLRSPALVILVGVQAVLGWLVAVADYDLAAAYRDVAAETRARWIGDGTTTWYLGGWGWIYYAERAGLHALSYRRPFPREGDRIVQPMYVSRVNDVQGLPGSAQRARKLDEITRSGRVPFRSVHADGANFYAVIARREQRRRPTLPFRWLPREPVERFEIYQIRAGPDA